MDNNSAEQYLEPILGAEAGSFLKLRTIPIFSFHMLVSTLISFVGVILAVAWPPEERCHAYFIMIYLRVAFWIVTFLCDHLVKYFHDHHRLRGYHAIYRSTKMVREAPMVIVSAWSVVLMAVQNLMQHYYGDHFAEHCTTDQLYSPLNYVTLFSVVETVVLGCVHFSYIGQVKQFNREMSPPDALRENYNNLGSVGFTQQGATLVELVEKQADLIDFYKTHLMRMHSLVSGQNRSYFRVTHVGGDEEEQE